MYFTVGFIELHSIDVPDCGAAVLNDLFSLKKNLKKNILTPVYCHQQNTLCCKYPAKHVAGPPTFGSRSKQHGLRQRSEETPGWKAGAITDVPVAFYNIIRCCTQFIRYKFTHFQIVVSDRMNFKTCKLRKGSFVSLHFPLKCKWPSCENGSRSGSQ